jgi:two-component system nitrate/nitrite response regulator NarL
MVTAMDNTAPRISLVVADDHPLVLCGLLDVLKSHPDTKIMAACSDGIAALKAISEFRPTVAVLDISMPGLNGLDVLANVPASQHSTKVVFLTATASDAQMLAAIAGGARGLMLKEAVVDDLIRCVRAVADGQLWLPSELVGPAQEREAGRQLNGDRINRSLSARERQVVLLVTEGLCNKQIGRRLQLTEGTVKIHLHNIYRKVDVANRTELTALAIVQRDQLRCEVPGWIARRAQDPALTLVQGRNCTHPAPRPEYEGRGPGIEWEQRAQTRGA